MVPHGGDLLEVERELALAQELEGLAVRFHQAVLDAVVDHLDEVARAAGTDVLPAAGQRERFEDGCADLDVARVAADHHAVTLVTPPDAAAGADVEEPDAALAQSFRAAERVLEV